MGLKCLKCSSEELVGIVTIQKAIPMAQKGGSLLMRSTTTNEDGEEVTVGEKVSQKEIKDTWDKTHDGQDRVIRGPIVCLICEAQHYYLKGAVPALRLGSYEEAVDAGPGALLAGDD